MDYLYKDCADILLRALWRESTYMLQCTVRVHMHGVLFKEHVGSVFLIMRLHLLGVYYKRSSMLLLANAGFHLHCRSAHSACIHSMPCSVHEGASWEF